MPYPRKLLLAKILVSLAILAHTLVPVITFFLPDGILWGNLLALPVLLYVLWGNLHGTGRSVRLVAFLGMAYSIGFFVASAQSGADTHLPIFAPIFLALLVGAILSLRLGKNPE